MLGHDGCVTVDSFLLQQNCKTKQISHYCSVRRVLRRAKAVRSEWRQSDASLTLLNPFLFWSVLHSTNRDLLKIGLPPLLFCCCEHSRQNVISLVTSDPSWAKQQKIKNDTGDHLHSFQRLSCGFGTTGCDIFHDQLTRRWKSMRVMMKRNVQHRSFSPRAPRVRVLPTQGQPWACFLAHEGLMLLGVWRNAPKGVRKKSGILN